MSVGNDEDALLRLVPANGDSIGNVSLMRHLGWDENKYWKVREKLLADGVLTRGRGKGGSVRRQTPVESTAAAKPAKQNRGARSSEAERTAEADLYEPLIGVLAGDWIRDMRIDPTHIHFENTARQGKKVTGGTWTRPDISAVSVRTFPHLPNKYLDIWTFEVKPADSFDVTAVYEAAAHGARATRSYALLQIAEPLTSEKSDVLARCEREAARLRVGLITFTDARDFKTWETLVEAPRLPTDPEDLEAFIAQLSQQAKLLLAKWSRAAQL